MLSPTCVRSAWGLLALNHLTGWYLGYKGRGGENTACIRIREGDALLPHTVQDVRRYIHSFIHSRALSERECESALFPTYTWHFLLAYRRHAASMMRLDAWIMRNPMIRHTVLTFLAGCVEEQRSRGAEHICHTQISDYSLTIRNVPVATLVG